MFGPNFFCDFSKKKNKKMQPILLLLFFTIFLFIFFLYVLICGNNKFHRDGCIGEIYYSLMFRFPNFLNTFFLKFVPEKFKSKDPKDPVCLGQGGFCRYFIILFYLSFYLAFFVIYMVYLFPNMHILYPENTRFFITGITNKIFPKNFIIAISG